MANGRVPGPLDTASSSPSDQRPSRCGALVTTPGPLDSARLGVPGWDWLNTGRGKLNAPRLVGLTITHGARRTSRAGRYESYLFAGQSVIVLAMTEPDNWSTWSQIRWKCDWGKPITGYGNGWRIPRTEIRKVRVSASLGGVTARLVVSIDTLADINSSSATGSPGSTPLNPIGTYRKINLYGDYEAKGFEDYAALKVYQAGANHLLRPLTKALVNAPPPDGPGLDADCASDIFMRAAPFYSPSYYAIERIRRKDRCRITFAAAIESENERFLRAFADASHIQKWLPKGDRSGYVHVIEYPREAVWTAAADIPHRVVPPPDPGFPERKIRVNEGED